MPDESLEALRRCNPAGHALPLLRLLAMQAVGAVVIAGAGTQRWQLHVQPP